MSKQLNLQKFKDTPVIKKLKKSESSENLADIEKQPVKRGRKAKYSTEEERNQARKEQQKQYRERKKKEIEELKERIKELEKVEV